MPKPLVRPKPGTIVIEFGPDTDYEGVEVTLTRRISLDAALAFSERAGDAAQTRDSIRELGDTFILDWNLADPVLDGEGNPVLDDEGNPVLCKAPISGERLLAEGYELGTKISTTLAASLAGTGLNPPTPPPSNNGHGSAAALTPTENPLESPLSWPEPN